jgi:putative glutathione S-transferase
MQVYAVPGVADASNIRHCKQGYFGRTGNNIVPLGPELAFQFEH